MNIWRDPDAAAFVRGHRDGNETVPTAVTGRGDLIDATSARVKEHLARSVS